MARRGANKRGSKYTNTTRLRNRMRKLNKHLKNNPNDGDAIKALSIK
jgi:ribosomal protein S15P/S13E